MKKTYVFLFALSFLLSACGGSEESTDENADESKPGTYFTYKTAEFQMQIPDDWEIMDSFTSEYPNELRVAFRNQVKDTSFTANVSVIREENTRGDSSYDFAQRKLKDHKETLLSYELLEQEVTTLSVSGAESKTLLSTFKGKNESSGLSLNFMQVSLTDSEKAWTVTASYRTSEDEFTIEKMETMLRSFSLN